MLRILNVVGTRPNLVKMASLWRAQRDRSDVIEPVLVHTGQHHDPAMSERFFADFELPQPDVMLPSKTGTYAAQLGGMILELERAMRETGPDIVVVVGDVTSTLAGTLAATGLGIPVAHVEAGLRSFDRTMPEETNRVLVDAVASHLFASEASAITHLRREGRPDEAIHHVGNVMIDTLVRFRDQAGRRRPADRLSLEGRYGVVTLHRPGNVDQPRTLLPILRALAEVARRLPLVFPMHPRTRDRLRAADLWGALESVPGLHVSDPLGYVDMLALMQSAEVILTDSGGVQEEATFLGVPCLTLRDNTERPATVTDGTNRVIGTRPARIVREVERLLAGDRPPVRLPPLWDGAAAPRVVEVLLRACWADEAPAVVAGPR